MARYGRIPCIALVQNRLSPPAGLREEGGLKLFCAGGDRLVVEKSARPREASLPSIHPASIICILIQTIYDIVASLLLKVRPSGFTCQQNCSTNDILLSPRLRVIQSSLALSTAHSKIKQNRFILTISGRIRVSLNVPRDSLQARVCIAHRFRMRNGSNEVGTMHCLCLTASPRTLV
jgi:hypothetical protein